MRTYQTNRSCIPFIRRISGNHLTGILAAIVLGSSTAVSQQAPVQSLVIDCSKKHQPIVGFGTCGMYWNAGDLYTNKNLQKRYVEDLGATILRFCVPPVVLPNEIAESKDISYKSFDFKVPGTKNVVDYIASIYALNPTEMTIIATVWSPPGWMKTTGKTVGGGQLRPDRVEHYAKYLAEWVLYMQTVQKTPIHAFSIQNELLFKEPYDSCVYTPDLYRQVALATCDAFTAAKVNTSLFGPEHMTWDNNGNLKFVTPILQDPRGKQRFFAVASHGYVDGVKSAGSAEESAILWKGIQPLGVQWWMSETSGEQPGLLGTGQDSKGNLKPGALTLASRIHNALVYGNASAWVYWCYSAHSKKVDDSAAAEALMNGDQPSKKYYISKQFYRFIRPGAVRVDATPDGENNLQVSAFLHERNRSLTIVLLNHDTKEIKVALDIKGGSSVRSYEVYRTSLTEDCVKLSPLSGGSRVSLTLPPQCIVTLYGQ